MDGHDRGKGCVRGDLQVIGVGAQVIDGGAQVIGGRGAARTAAAVIAVLIGVVAYAAAYGQPPVARPRIPYYENLGELELRESEPAPNDRVGVRTSRAAVSFVAFGRQFDLLLEHDRSIVQRLSSSSRSLAADVELWRGQLRGLPESWVRLTRRGRFLAGVIWDGNQYLAVEPYSGVRAALVAPGPAAARDVVIYRADDLLAGLGDQLLVPGDSTLTDTADKALTGPVGEAKPGLSRGLQIEIGLIADAELVLREGSETPVSLLSIVNIVDGIFVQQLGVRLVVARIVQFDEEPDPFSTTRPSSLLDELGAYKAENPELESLGLAHLFTGRDLDDSGSGRTVGIAYLGALCDSFRSISVTESTNGVFFDALVAAHEIGHNFGAPHDADPGGACSDAPAGYLMDARISGSDTFSQCSVDQMLIEVAGTTCLQPIPRSDVSLTPTRSPTEVLVDEKFEIEFDIDSTGAEGAFGLELFMDANGATLDALHWPSSSADGLDCDNDGRHAVCTLHLLAGGMTIPISADLTAEDSGLVSFDAAVSSLNDTDVDNNALSLTIATIRSVKLRASQITPSAEVVRPGELVEVAIELVNEGAADATNAAVRIGSLPPSFELASSVLPGGGACMEQSVPNAWNCPVGTVPSGSVVALTVTLRALETGVQPGAAEFGSFEFELMADQRDVDTDHSWSVELGVAPVLATATIALGGPARLSQDDLAEFTMVVENLGPDTIPSMRVFYVNTGADADSWTSDAATCAWPGAPNQLQCDIGPMRPGKVGTISVSGVAEKPGVFTVQSKLSFDAFSPEPPLDNDRSRTWSVTARAATRPQSPIDTSSPSNSDARPGATSERAGGGAFGPFAVLLLAASALIRLRKAQRPHVGSRVDPVGPPVYR